MYLIWDSHRSGFLTWDYGDDKYLMAFTTSDKAEEYNAVVLKYRPGEVVSVKSSQSKELARKMVRAGVNSMIVDYPVINDQDFWDKPQFAIGKVPTEVGRNYGIVDLKKIVARV